MNSILFILPCYNEEKALPALLKSLQNVCAQLSLKTEIVVVNDHSTDQTPNIAREAGISLLDLPVNCGIGAAMQTAFKYAIDKEFDFAMQVDGDGQHPPKEIQKLIQAQQQSNSDVIIGSRFIEKKGYQSSTLRRIGINYLSLVNLLYTNKLVADTTSGFRLYNKKALLKVAENYPDEYPEPQSIIDFHKAGLTVKEVPVLMAERQGGQSSIRNFHQLYYLFKVTISMFFSFIRNKK